MGERDPDRELGLGIRSEASVGLGGADPVVSSPGGGLVVNGRRGLTGL